MQAPESAPAPHRLAPLFSSAKEDWETPDELFSTWHRIYNFTLDAAANEVNHKVPRWLGPGSSLGTNALSLYWGPGERVWINPPYQKKTKGVPDVGDWVRKGWEESQRGNLVVMLVAARTDTKWFHAFVYDRYNRKWRAGVEAEFIKGRVKFVGGRHGGTFPSLVVVFNPPANVRESSTSSGASP